METKLIFKMEKNPEGFNVTLAPDCKIKIVKEEGQLYLNYEKRAERIVGHFKNLRQEGESILAEVNLLRHAKDVESRFEYAIEGAILNKNEAGEADLIEVRGVAAIMQHSS